MAGFPLWVGFCRRQFVSAEFARNLSSPRVSRAATGHNPTLKVQFAKPTFTLHACEEIEQPLSIIETIGCMD
jgi:hypothetical protein